MSIGIFFIAIALLGAGYVFYGRFLRTLFGINLRRKTPAFTHADGVDYVPAKNWVVLFGHHFASIAGAGPIVGPVFAYIYWGWVGALIWIIVGSIFIGGVHDMASLFISVREKGSTIGQIASTYISRRASVVFLIFLWFALILVIAVFAALCAKSFVNEPHIVLPSLGMIPVALIVGILIYRLRAHIVFSTAVGLSLLSCFIFAGARFPVTLGGTDPYQVWLIVLLVYAFVASVVPVHILLQPRDYISSFLLFFGIAVATLGILLRPQPLAGTHLFSASASAGPFFPIMFITVACGAISGFHSLVSSGTTSKQIASEKDIQPVGYGSMILEGVLAAIALVCVAFGLKQIPAGKTPIEIFSLGFSRMAFFLGEYAGFIALVILNTFILTTLDTATRITRFLTQELLGINNKYWSTLLVIIVAGFFALTGTWQNLWPLFGASNQLVAGLALIVASGYLARKGKSSKATLIPALVMIVVTFCALGVEAVRFIREEKFLLLALSVTLMVMGVFILEEFRRSKHAKKT